MTGRSVSSIFWPTGMVFILNKWSNLFPNVVLNTGEVVDGKEKEVKDESPKSSRSLN